MAFNDEDYQNVRKHLGYTWYDIHSLTSIMDTKLAQYGPDWESAVKEMLTALDEIWEMRETQLSAPALASYSVVGEISETYSEPPINAYDRQYASKLADFVNIIEIGPNRIKNYIIR